MEITIWKTDLKDFEKLENRLVGLINSNNIKIERIKQNFMIVTGKRYILKALYE